MALLLEFLCVTFLTFFVLELPVKTPGRARRTVVSICVFAPYTVAILIFVDSRAHTTLLTFLWQIAVFALVATIGWYIGRAVMSEREFKIKRFRLKRSDANRTPKPSAPSNDKIMSRDADEHHGGFPR